MHFLICRTDCVTSLRDDNKKTRLSQRLLSKQQDGLNYVQCNWQQKKLHFSCFTTVCNILIWFYFYLFAICSYISLSLMYQHNTCSLLTTDICRLTTGIRSEKCFVMRFRRCANVIECTYTNLDSTDMRRLTTGIRSKKCVVRRFHRCANVIECTYT